MVEAVCSKEHLAADLKERLSSQTMVRLDEPLARKTTLRVGGPADFFVEPGSETDLAAVLQFCRERALPFFVLGRGSNLLIRDEGFRGLVISLGHETFSQMRVDGERFDCGSGVKLKLIAAEAKRRGLTGLEFLEGIPGNLGGALRMNAGAMGSATFNVVESVRVMDWSGQTVEIPRERIAAEYRSCPLLKNQIALGAVLRGSADAGVDVAARMKGFSAKRWESQPKEPSAGCIFKNPPDVPAGKLVEELGLKGMSVGGARVSEVHGNFIVNSGNATARNVLDLIELIRDRAKAERGIDLRTEVEIVGG